MTIDQLSYTWKFHTNISESNVPLIDQLHLDKKTLGARMYTSLMGTFDFPTPINFLGLTSVGKIVCTLVDRTDPWVLPSQANLDVPLSAT